MYLFRKCTRCTVSWNILVNSQPTQWGNIEIRKLEETGRESSVKGRNELRNSIDWAWEKE